MLGDAVEKIEHEQGKKRVHRKTHGKIGFADMAKIIGSKWKVLPQEERDEFVKIAVVEKEKYAKDLAQWREEQKNKTMANGMGLGRKIKVSKRTGPIRKYDENADLVQSIARDRENLLRQHQAFRMQMMQEMQVGHLSSNTDEGYGQKMPTIDYLRNVQDDRSASFFARTPSSLFSHYPSAAEGSGRDLYQQMVAMTSGSEGQGREFDFLRPLKMTRINMKHSSMNDRPGGSSMGGRVGTIGGAMDIMSNQMETSLGAPMVTPMEDKDICNRMGNSDMTAYMGLISVNNGASQIPNLSHHSHYEMERYQPIPYQNQMPRIHNNRLSDSRRAGDTPTYKGRREVATRRFHS